MGVEIVPWLWLAFWLTVVFALACASWHYRDYPEKMALIRRAEQQHQQLMDGDDRSGIYGQYPPADLT